MHSNKTKHRVPDHIRVQSIETLQVSEADLNYLRQNGYRTIEDVIARQFEIPKEHRLNIYAYLMYGIKS